MTKYIFFFLFLQFGIQHGLKAQYVEKQEEEIKTSDTELPKEDFVALSVGFSNPVGDYGDKNLNNFYAGYADVGYNLNFVLSRYLRYDLSLVFMGSHSSHEFDTEVIQSSLESTDPQARHSVSSGFYNSSGLMVGLSFALPFSNGFFDIRALGGYSFSSRPSIYITRDDGRQFNWARWNSASTNAFSLNLGVDLRYHLNEKWGFIFSVDYYGTNPEFNFEIDYDNSDRILVNYQQSITTLNVTFGFYRRIPRIL